MISFKIKIKHSKTMTNDHHLHLGKKCAHMQYHMHACELLTWTIHSVNSKHIHIMTWTVHCAVCDFCVFQEVDGSGQLTALSSFLTSSCFI